METKSIQFKMVQMEKLTTKGAEALIVFTYKDQGDPPLLIHPEMDKQIRALQSKKIYSGQAKEVEVLHTYGLIPYDYVILIGLGDQPGTNPWREAGARAARTAEEYKVNHVHVRFQSDSDLQALTEGFILGNYRMNSYQKNDEKNVMNLQKVTFLVPDEKQNIMDLENSLEAAKIYASAVNYARDLTNLPGNYLVPSMLADEALRLSEEKNLTCEICDEEEILRLGMGGLYEVGKGSMHPPRMIVLKYQGLDQWTDVLGLVGKGITFDTGGISLKKAEGMEEMISDMGGAAAVMGVMHAIGELRPKINLLAVIPAAENMPSGSAYKPGDIVTTMSGLTVEVINTDAEGRIVLADGLTYAQSLGAEKLIDIATLTGAVLVALGDVATGAVTNDQSFIQDLMKAADETGEKVWEFPAYPEYWDLIKSPVADVKNSGGKWAGTITAALFVGTFAGNKPWIHLDTGGTAWLWKERGYDPKGGTGAMVRTLLQMIRTEAEKY